MTQVQQNLGELIRLGAAYLVRHGVTEAQVVCELLWARVLKCGRLELLTLADSLLSEPQLAAMRRGLKRVASGEPVQYVLGEWEFRNLRLKVDKRALIPRPETEQLVELVLHSAQVQECEKPLVVDVGTGSGCIILSLAQELADGVFVGIDKSSDALELAKENAVLVGLKDQVLFALSDGCSEFDPASIDVLVSNPPYIPTAMLDGLDRHIREHEPLLALDGGADGLVVFRDILLDAVMVLKPGGSIFLETGDDQGDAVAMLLEEYGFSDVLVSKDYAGHNRFVSGVLEI